MSMCAIACKCFKHFGLLNDLFFSLFTGIGQKWVKLVHFVPNHLYQFYLNIFTIVVLINKAFKLFKFVLVVYCGSCCHW